MTTSKQLFIIHIHNELDYILFNLVFLVLAFRTRIMARSVALQCATSSGQPMIGHQTANTQNVGKIKCRLVSLR